MITLHKEFKNYERLEDSCWSKYVIYNIQVLRGRSTWMIKRRYSEFVKLLNYLLIKYPTCKEPFPSLPPKTYSNISEDNTFINDRKQKLARFLDELLKTMHIEKLLTDPILIDFLGFCNYNLEMTTNSLNKS